MNLSRISVIAICGLCLFGLTGAECSRAEIDRATAILRKDPVPPPTEAEISQFSQYLAENPDVRAKLVGDLSAGSVVVSALISSAQLESSSEPVSSEVVVAVVKPPTPVAVTVREDDWIWRGTVQPGACHVEYH